MKSTAHSDALGRLTKTVVWTPSRSVSHNCDWY